MNRIRTKALWLFVVMAIVVAFSQVAKAQPDEGRRDRGGRGGRDFGGFPVTSVRLAGVEKVATELKLTDDQKTKIEEINDQMRDDLRAAFEDGGGREKMQELFAAASAKLGEVLDDGQQSRLTGILIQINGAGATSDPAVAAELNITDEQKTKLQEVRQENMDSMREAFDEIREQNLSREEIGPKMEKLREEGNQKLLAVLTGPQQEQLDALKGEPFEIDMRELRGGRGGRFGDRGDRRGGRDREDRDRDSESDESKSSDESESK